MFGMRLFAHRRGISACSRRGIGTISKRYLYSASRDEGSRDADDYLQAYEDSLSVVLEAWEMNKIRGEDIE